ncbi:hypothetical protein BCR33DRAFT_431902 [Rhizoclosmatium globosum]|uniref:Uncharacterized protein n=1 Tax=Rhizoclosmatium globosum TaxID=329046 RepID=A0A1Y2BTM8_9FUNG|nr:hypothetical protein BCR33DRAFT_431902 [Rhizoclosmatium globosum]|eukprot:ORY38112.1 hypothetical protein BCR33DRAFT_431902 [Rhizoclosmatium globosum]
MASAATRRQLGPPTGSSHHKHINRLSSLPQQQQTTQSQSTTSDAILIEDDTAHNNNNANRASFFSSPHPSLLPRRTHNSLYGIPSMDRRGAVDSGTLKSTLTRLDRIPTIKRAKPMLRSPSADPPAARLGATRVTLPRNPDPVQEEKEKNARKFPNIWAMFAKLLTCCFIPPILRFMGKKNPVAQQAWREKVALCFIIFIMCGMVGFLTFGLERTFCPPPSELTVPYFNTTATEKFKLSNDLYGHVIIRGYAYDYANVSRILFSETGMDISGNNYTSLDLSKVFTAPSYCKQYPTLQWNCGVIAADSNTNHQSLPTCPSLSLLDGLPRKRVTFSWDDILSSNSTLKVFNTTS